MGKKRSITGALWGQFDSSMQMMERLIQGCPDDRWTELCGQVPFWHQVYHVVFFIDFWLRKDYRDENFRSMQLDPRISPELGDPIPAGLLISREDMSRYLNLIWEKSKAIFDGLEDNVMGREVVEGAENYTWADIITGQIRHIMYNIGYLNAFLRQDGLPESDWYAYNEEPGS